MSMFYNSPAARPTATTSSIAATSRRMPSIVTFRRNRLPRLLPAKAAPITAASRPRSSDPHSSDRRGGRYIGFLGEPGPREEGGPQSALHAREPAEEAAEHSTDRHHGRREGEPAKGRHEIDSREDRQQQADREFDRGDRCCPAEEIVAGKWRHVGEPNEQGRSGKCRGDRRQAEAKQHAAVDVPAHQDELEKPVGQMHHRRHPHRLLDGEEEAQGRQQQCPEAEAREEGQACRHEGGAADDQVEQQRGHRGWWGYGLDHQYVTNNILANTDARRGMRTAGPGPRPVSLLALSSRECGRARWRPRRAAPARRGRAGNALPTHVARCSP